MALEYIIKHRNQKPCLLGVIFESRQDAEDTHKGYGCPKQDRWYRATLYQKRNSGKGTITIYDEDELWLVYDVEPWLPVNLLGISQGNYLKPKYIFAQFYRENGEIKPMKTRENTWWALHIDRLKIVY